MTRIVAAVCVLCAVALADLAAQSSRDLAERIDGLLDEAPFDRHLWGVAVADERGRPLYQRNADKLFTPASNVKLVVSAVASALLPPDWTVRTSLYAGGPVVDGVLHGDLVLYGRGDPTFSVRCYGLDTLAAGACDTDPLAKLRTLAAALQARGIRTVAGDLVGDGSYFEPLLVHPTWEVYDVNWWYAAPVAALGFNDNSIDIRWAPGSAVGAPASVAFSPDFGEVVLENRARTAEPGTDNTIDFFRIPGTLTLWAQGSVALNARGGIEHFALPDPNLYTARALRAALAEAGIAVTGTTRSTVDSTLYAEVRRDPPLAEVTSRPLRDWIFPILNTSQNWFAEMVLKQLGKQFGRAGSWEEGLRVERRFLIDSVGIDSTEFALTDGSGLSSANLVTPRAFTTLLRYMRQHPRWATFAAGLPIAGRPGSLRARFRGTPVDGKVAAKTGSIARTNTLSGYVQTPAGRILTFSIQANHQTLSGSVIMERIDRVVTEMASER